MGTQGIYKNVYSPLNASLFLVRAHLNGPGHILYTQHTYHQVPFTVRTVETLKVPLY